MGDAKLQYGLCPQGGLALQDTGPEHWGQHQGIWGSFLRC